MARVTNEELAGLIGVVDDGVIGLKGEVGAPVSYTHLTLPTILLV